LSYSRSTLNNPFPIHAVSSHPFYKPKKEFFDYRWLYLIIDNFLADDIKPLKPL
jgi:hypothetical protein